MHSASLQGKAVLVTGGTGGIGRALALELAARGADVFVVGRNPAKGEAAAADLRAAGAPNAGFFGADLSEMRQVRDVAAWLLAHTSRLHTLVHSAGLHHYQRTRTSDGVEFNVAANYLNRFLLTELLRDALLAAAPSRVLVVGSPYVFDPARRLSFEGVRGETPMRPIVGLLKAGMMNSVWTVALARRLAGLGVAVVNGQPGIVQTDILRDDPPLVRLMDKVMQPLRGMDAAQAGRHYAQLALMPLAPNAPLFYQNTRRGMVPSKVPPGTFDAALAERLWAFSQRLTSP